MIAKFEKRKKGVFVAVSFLGFVAIIFVLAAIIYLTISNIKISRKKDKLDNQILSIKKEIEDFENKNLDLKKGIEKVGDPEYVEKIAREELTLQKEGEKVVGFILPPNYQKQDEKINYWHPKNWWGWFKNKWSWIVSKF